MPNLKVTDNQKYAGLEGFELSTSGVKVLHSNQLRYSPLFVGILGLEPRTSASETDVLTNYTHIPILFVVQVGIEPAVAVKVMILKTLFNPHLLSPILKGFFCTICRGSRTRTDSTCSQSTQATIKPHTPN